MKEQRGEEWQFQTTWVIPSPIRRPMALLDNTHNILGLISVAIRNLGAPITSCK